jgi:dienelactone hydrolase
MKALPIAIGLAVSACSTTAIDAPPANGDQSAALEADGSGPHPATYLTVPSLPNHVVYLPRDLGALGDMKLGIYAFGNGGCSANGVSARNHLLDVASHGYIAIAPGVIPGPNRETPRPRELPSGLLSADTPASALGEAIDWAIRQNATGGSPLQGLVATDQVAVSGWSCGGLQAMMNAGDPRVATTIIMNSGIFNNEVSPIQGIEARKPMLNDLHGPTLFVLGGEEDAAQPNGLDDFSRIRDLPAAVVDLPVGHGGTFDRPDGGVGSEVVVAWLNWVLKDQADSAKRFEGANCTYCNDPRFIFQRKNISE